MHVLEVGLQLISNSVTDSIEKSMLNRWIKEYKSYQMRYTRRSQILKAIAEGYDVSSEIAAETGIPPATVRRILIELIAKNRVRSVKTKNLNNRIEIRFEKV